MPKQLFASRPRAKFWIFSGFVFVAGLVVGLLLGIYGFRYFFFRFPPSGDEIVARVVSRIDKDFSLDGGTRARVDKEVRTLLRSLHALMTENRRMADEAVSASSAAIADILPESQRQRWRDESPAYFPRGPRPPPPPPPIPPSP